MKNSSIDESQIVSHECQSIVNCAFWNRHNDECLIQTITIDEASINVNSLYERWMNLGEYM